MRTQPNAQEKVGYTSFPSVWYLLARIFFSLFGWLAFRITVIGKSNIPRGNYIVVGNHLSWIDPFLLMIVLPAKPRLYFIGARQAVNRNWKAQLVRKFDVMIPFERGARWVGKDIFAKPLQVIQAGAALGLFPEGCLGSREGAVLPLQRGIGHIALRADCPILPVALSGVQELYLGKPITVIIGKPFRVASDLPHHDAVNRAVEQVASALRAILPAYQEPHPRFKPMRFLTNLLG